MTDTIAVCFLVCVKGDSGTHSIEIGFLLLAIEEEEEENKH